MKHSISTVLIFLLCVAIWLPCYATPSSASTIPEKKVVKIGWFASDGVHAIDSDGSRSGYDYDYLQAISQYTDWEYEFVEGTWAQCYNWLKNGDIDLLGIVNKTPEREQIFDYSYTSAGTEMCCLFTSLGDKRYAYQDFDKFDGMTIAIEEGTYQSTVLEEYATENNFTYSTITYPTLADAQKSVDTGETDALLSSNTDVISGYKAIAQFNPIPFYYATTKGNTELLKELNYAMNELLTYYPKFSNDLYSRYYGSTASSDAVFTSDELAYIKSSPTIHILYDLIWYPIESYNPKTDSCEGIVPDLLDLISKKSGLKFVYDSYPNSVDVLKSFENQRGNFVTSITYDYKWAKLNDMNITQPFLDTSVVCASKDSKRSPKTVALVKRDYISEMVKTHLPHLEPIYFDSMADCIESVRLGMSDCAYLNNYEAEYYMTIAKYRDLSFHTTDLFRQKIGLGISKGADPLLFSIISKSLQSIPPNDMQNLIYKNSYHIAPATLESFARANPILVIFIAMSFILVILVGALLLLRSEIKTARRMGVENERYHQLAAMTDEHIYEYNYQTDTLTFNHNPDSYLGGSDRMDEYSKFIDNGSLPRENTLYSVLCQKKDATCELEIVNIDGSKAWHRITCKVIQDELNAPVYAIGKLLNIQSEYEEKLHLIDCANRDGLTGLYNSKAYNEKISPLIKKGSTLFVIDVDLFKNINDTYGHYSGDEVLVNISDILKNIFDKTGIISRLGGDEFSVFLPEPKKKAEIESLCKQLLCEVGEIKITPTSSPITLSIGVAKALMDDSFLPLYKRADTLLYAVKNDGRNGYRVS